MIVPRVARYLGIKPKDINDESEVVEEADAATTGSNNAKDVEKKEEDGKTEEKKP